MQEGTDLGVDAIQLCIQELMSGKVAQDAMRAFLTQLHHKGETVDEIVGAALALRQEMVPVQLNEADLVDTCGTGGDGSSTFNVSTSAAIVAAAAGIHVAKHGNRKITSQSGSADVLTELGVEISCDEAVARKCMERSGVCFLFAPQFHPAMRHVSAARKALPFPTIFNMLGPLANPASVPFQMLGVGKPEAWDLLVPALGRLTTKRAIAVRGEDGLGELSVLAKNRVAVIENGQVQLETWDPADFGLAGGTLADIQVPDPATSAQLIRKVFNGEAGTARNMVVWNAAATIWLVQGGEMADAVLRAQQAIDSGKAAETLAILGETSRQSA